MNRKRTSILIAAAVATAIAQEASAERFSGVGRAISHAGADTSTSAVARTSARVAEAARPVRVMEGRALHSTEHLITTPRPAMPEGRFSSSGHVYTPNTANAPHNLAKGQSTAPRTRLEMDLMQSARSRPLEGNNA